MVDARAVVGDLLIGSANPVGEHHRRALHAVAEAAYGQLRKPALHRPAEHRHRVRVVEDGRLGGVPGDVADDIEHDRDRAQRAEDARRAASVADVGIHAVLLRDLDVGAEDLRSALQDRDQDAVRALDSLLAIRGGDDLRGVVPGGDDLLDRLPAELETLGINVHERERAV